MSLYAASRGRVREKAVPARDLEFDWDFREPGGMFVSRPAK